MEEEAAGHDASEVTIEHVRACQKRFLDRMEDEVRGFQVETCFGPGGCPNRAVALTGRLIPMACPKGLKRVSLKET